MDSASNFHNQTRNTGHPSSGFGNEPFSPFNFSVNSTQDYANARQQNIPTVQSTGFTNTNYDSGANYGMMETSVLQNNEVTFIDRKTGTEYNAEGKAILPPTTDVELNQLSGAAQLNQSDKQVLSEEAYQPRAPWYQGQTGHQPYLNHQQQTTYHPDPMQQPYLSGQIYPQSNNRPFDSSAGIVQPGTNFERINNTANIPDYFALSLIVTLCCCWPIGVCALCSSRKIPSLKLQGKYQEARDLSQQVLSLNILAIVLGILITGGIIGFTVWRMNSYT